ncbi:hypothetical protein QN277_021207 [Acacia crassicarpa]|uniref:Lipid droplet-associated hydrolase n=1 Tax=Acacia crassicarpa TaxID=499986 RepID=A0AAE1JNB0_9FABA|nr:hypothetical protein QN277_021207 [Acacia crassicarpa]
MLHSRTSSTVRFIPQLLRSSRTIAMANCTITNMVTKSPVSKTKKCANFRLCNVSSYTTELLEIRAEDPSFHVLLIPGNPGVVAFYVHFIEFLYEQLGGNASITAIGHISHTMKDWERGRLFSIEEQINHKVVFIREELQNADIPILLVGHSIGAYISLEVFKRWPEKVRYCIALYPFLTLNQNSRKQINTVKFVRSPFKSTAFSCTIALLGLLPTCAFEFFVRKSLGESWSTNAVKAACSHLSKYHTVRNILFMAKTEFKKLSEAPDWAFIRQRKTQLAFLYGVDDHWGPLEVHEELSRQVPDVPLAIERENHTHSFCCTEEGSLWVAQHVASLLKDQMTCKSTQERTLEVTGVVVNIGEG